MLGGVWGFINANKKTRAGFIILAAFVLMALLAPVLAPYDPQEPGPSRLEGPSREHWMGTTTMGQDVFSQVLYGTRVTLFVGLIVGAATTLISVLVGMTAGYFSGKTDSLLSMLINVFLVIPALPLMILIAAYLNRKDVFTIILAITVTGWAWGARIFRAQMMSLKNQDFVAACEMIGEKPARVMFSEIAPNMYGLIAANFFGSAIYAIISEAGLEFLGLGNVSIVSWGTMLYWAQSAQAVLLGLWLWVIAPGLLIALLGVSFALINFGIDELSNPTLRE
jgi:peptide/nickel transport system permease protein